MCPNIQFGTCPLNELLVKNLHPSNICVMFFLAKWVFTVKDTNRDDLRNKLKMKLLHNWTNFCSVLFHTCNLGQVAEYSVVLDHSSCWSSGLYKIGNKNLIWTIIYKLQNIMESNLLKKIIFRILILTYSGKSQYAKFSFLKK